jgi:hypothetical protein
MMSDDSKENQLDVSDIAKQLREGRLSRGGLADRLKALGIGFGAAFVLGVSGAQAATTSDAAVLLKSTNTALNGIIQSEPQTPTPSASAPLQQTAWYYRYYHRYYRRFYHRY